LCLVAGANSVFYGDTLLTTPNAGIGEDAELFAAIGEAQGNGVSATAA
jgi:biotin synthase